MQEVINRGGETLSPFEVEDAVRTHPSVEDVMAFATPHRQEAASLNKLL